MKRQPASRQSGTATHVVPGNKNSTGRIRRMLRLMLISVAIVYALLMLGLAGIRYVLLPTLSHYKPQLEQVLSAHLHQPVSIGQADVVMTGWHPQVRVRQLKFGTGSDDGTMSPPLSVERIDATLAWRSILHPFRPVFVNIDIQHPDVLIERKNNQQIVIAGIPLQAETADTSQQDLESMLRWWLTQQHIQIGAATVRWRDAEAGTSAQTAVAKTTVLRGLVFQQYSGWNRLLLSLRYVPPPELMRAVGAGPTEHLADISGLPLDLRAELHHAAHSKLSDLSGWSGKLYASSGDLAENQWAVLLQLLSGSSFSEKNQTANAADRADGGSIAAPALDGKISAWAELAHGELRQLDAQIQLHTLRWQGAADSVPVALSGLSAAVTLSAAHGLALHHPDTAADSLLLSVLARNKAQLAWRDMTFATSDGTVVPPFSGSLAITQASNKTPVGASSSLADQSVGHVAPVQITGLVSQLAVKPVAVWLQTLPPSLLPRDIADKLGQTQPQGQIQQARFSFGLEYASSAPVAGLPAAQSDWQWRDHYSLQASLQGLAVKALTAPPRPDGSPEAGIPGVRGVNASIDLNEQHGKLRIDSHDLVISAPGVAGRDDWPFSLAEVVLNWQRNDQGVLLDIAHAVLKNDHQTLTFNGTQQIPLASGNLNGNNNGKKPGGLDAQWRLTLDAVDLRQLDQFLPLSMGHEARHWLVQGLTAGTVSDLSVKATGDLHRLAEENGAHWNGQGQPPAAPILLVSAHLHDVTVNIAPGYFAPGSSENSKPPVPEWPLFEQVDGTLNITDAALGLQISKAKANGLPLAKTVIRITDLYSHHATLTASGVLDTDAGNMVSYVRSSPVDHMLGGLLTQASLKGNAVLNLGLTVPLEDPEQTQMNSTLVFNGVDGHTDPAFPGVSGLKGTLLIRHDGFSLPDGELTGQLLGFPVRIDGAQKPGQPGSVNIVGRAAITALRDEYHDAEWAPVLRYLSGDTDVRLNIGWHDHHTALTLNSSLTGSSSVLPAPFAKEAAATVPLSLALFDAEPLNLAEGALHRKLDLSIGTLMSGHYDLIHAGGTGAANAAAVPSQAAWSLASGSVGVGQAPPPVSILSHAIAVGVTADRINLDDWLEVISTVRNAAPSSASLTAGRQLAVSLPHPEHIEARIAHLVAAGTDWQDMKLRATARGDDWHAAIDAPALAGQADWIAAAKTSQKNGSMPGDQVPGLLRARLDRLLIPSPKEVGTGSNADSGTNVTPPAATAAHSANPATRQSTPLPAIDLEARQFVLHGHDLGTLNIKAQHRIADHQSIWTISQIGIDNPDARFDASGDWTSPDTSTAGGRTHMRYSMKMNDSGQLLGRFGLEKVLAASKGTLGGDIAWNGAPYALDIPSLDGSLQFETGKGQFLQIDPGAGRLLSVLNLQSLSRRAQLDFRDIFSRGLAFDSTQGALTIHQGVATTDNLRIVGPAGTVLLDGTVDLAAETQNMHVIVLPDVNLGAASLGLVVVNPIVGIGSALAQYMLKDKLASALRFEYDVSGPWSNPSVVRVERRSTANEVSQRRREGPSQSWRALDAEVDVVR